MENNFDQGAFVPPQYANEAAQMDKITDGEEIAKALAEIGRESEEAYINYKGIVDQIKNGDREVEAAQVEEGLASMQKLAALIATYESFNLQKLQALIADGETVLKNPATWQHIKTERDRENYQN